MDVAKHADPDAILARFRTSGAPRDLGSLFDVTAGDLYRVALATAPDAAAAEDAVQETYLAVISAAARWDPSRRAMPWLLGILRFKVTRQREKARLPAANAVGRESAAPAMSDGDPEAAALAWAEIERLDEPYRAVALMRWRYGLSPAEIAHIRGEAPGTTRSLLSRALDRVRKTLKVMPAGLVLLGRPARGLDAVRADVLDVASSTPAVATTTGSFGLRALVAALLVSVVGTGVFFAVRTDAPPSATLVADAPAPAADATTLAAPPARSLAIGAPAVPVAGPRAHGRVVDDTGKPIANAAVSSVGADAYAFERPVGFESDVPSVPPATRTGYGDSDGRFDVPLDDRYPTHLLLVSAPGRAPRVVGPLRPGADASDVILGAGEVWGGRVLDGSKAPIAGARVRACVVMPWFAFVREATTDASGAFRLEAMPEPQPSRIGVLPTMAWLSGSGAAAAPAVIDVPMDPLARRGELELVLRRGSRLSGRVLDADTGGPVPSAEVKLLSTEMGHGWSQGNWMTRMTGTSSPFQDALITVARTDADGAFAVDRVPCLAGPRPPPVEKSADRRPFAGQLRVSADGYAPGRVLVRQIEEDGSETRDVKLWRPAVVKGRLVDGDGKALVDVRGVLEVGSPATWTEVFTTDKEGKYVVGAIPAAAGGTAGRVRVYGDAGRVDVPIEARGGAITDAPDLVVQRTQRAAETSGVRVNVIDASGAPIWGAGVELGSNGSGASTDRFGAAFIPASIARFKEGDPLELSAWASGFVRATVRAGRDTAFREPSTIRLEVGRRITGIVRSADGTPAVGVGVRADRTEPGSRPLPIANAPIVATDSHGAFAFEDLTDDVFALTAKARAESHSESAPSATVESVRAGSTNVVIQLPADTRESLGQLEVVVIDDATNAPLAGGYVRLRRGEKDTIWAHATTPGHHVAKEIPPGRWNVRAFVDGYELKIVPDVAIDVASREAPLEVRLHRAETRTVVIRGGPSPSPTVDLCFVGADGVGVIAKRDGDRPYVAISLRPQAYRVALGWRADQGPGLMKGWVAEGNFVDVEAGDPPVEVRLVPAGAVTLTIDDPLLAAPGPPDATEAARARSAASSLVLRDDRQRVIVKRTPLYRTAPGRPSDDVTGLQLAPGRYTARLERPGETPIETDIEISAGIHVVRTIGGH